jgi:DNA mismatch repair protein MutS
MSEAPPDKLTPMLKQYLDLKSRYADALLLFQMGDFYETFFADAEQAAQALSITLTSRSRAGEERIPMAGFPIHAAQGYLTRLLEQGFKVVVCDQTEDPAQAKGLVRREVTRILTRGTVVDPWPPCSAGERDGAWPICRGPPGSFASRKAKAPRPWGMNFGA